MSLRRQFFKFVAPSIASMWIFSLYSMVDGMFVAKGVGEQALAAVNLSLPYVNVVFALGLIFATGTSTLISVALGMEERERACRYFNQNLAVVAVVCAALTAVTLLALEPIARFLGGGDGTLGYVKQYVGTIAPFAVFFAVSYNLEVQVKADGAPQISTCGVCACGLMNVALDALFVLRFHWGVWGAALATGLAQVTSTVIFVLYFRFRSRRLSFGRFGRELAVYRKIVPLGLADGLTEFSNGLVIFAFNLAIIRVLGPEKVTSYTVISYVNTLVLMTMSGTAQGIQPLVSFHFGAGKKDVCRTLLRYGLTAAAVFGAVLFAAAELLAPALVGFFLEESSALYGYTVAALRVFAFSFLPVGFNVVTAGYFTAVERPAFAFPISVGRSCVLLLLALGVTAFAIGGEAIWLATTLSEGVCLVMTASFLLRGQRAA